MNSRTKKKSFEQVRWEMLIHAEKREYESFELALEGLLINSFGDKISLTDAVHIRENVREAVETNPEYNNEELATWIAHAAIDLEIVAG